MLKNNIKISFRNLLKNRMLTVVNFIGLTVGLAAMLCLAFIVHAYYSADDAIGEKEELVYLKSMATAGHSHNATTYPLVEEIQKTCPEVEAGTSLVRWGTPWLTYNQIELQEDKALYVNTDFFKTFKLSLKYGDVTTALQNKYDVVLTDKVSKKFFGDTNPVGKTMKINDTISLKVAGVLEPMSAYSSLQLGVVLTTKLIEDNASFREHANWSNSFTTTYLRLKPKADIQKLENEVFEILQQNYGEPELFSGIKAMPFTHFRADILPISQIIIKGCIATIIFVLLIVMVNLINLNSSSMYDRAQQLAVRKVLGSSKWSMIRQYGVENGILVLSSLTVSLLLFTLVLLPRINQMFSGRFGKISFSITNDATIIFYFIGLAFIITLAITVLPILRFISLPVSTAIKGKVDAAKKSFFARNAFITLQFTLAILFICTAVILNRQIDFMQNVPLGYTQDNIVAAKINLDYKNTDEAESKFAVIVNKLKSNPYVLGFATSQMVPSTYFNNYTEFITDESQNPVRFRYAKSDAHYLNALSIPLVHGRNFDDKLEASEGRSVIINAKAMKALGWNGIENKRLKYMSDKGEGYKVVGVMEDFHYRGVDSQIEPLIHFYNGKRKLEGNNYLTLNIVKGKEKEVMQSLESDFSQIASKRTFEYDYLSDKVSGQYNLLRGMLKMVNAVAFFTILISCMGMFGLISLIAKKRVKEIGIRKVLGAGVAKILILLSKEFIMLVVIASAIALPLTWWMMNSWLQTFATRIEVKVWMLALGGLLALLIVTATVSFRAFKSAIANPIKALRTE